MCPKDTQNQQLAGPLNEACLSYLRIRLEEDESMSRATGFTWMECRCYRVIEGHNGLSNKIIIPQGNFKFF